MLDTATLPVNSGDTATFNLVVVESDDGMGGPAPGASLVGGEGVANLAARIEVASGDAILSNFSLNGAYTFPIVSNPAPNPLITPSLIEFQAFANAAAPGSGLFNDTVVVGSVDVTVGLLDSIVITGNLSNPVPNTIRIADSAFAAPSVRTRP
tara:strand:+ start:87537 stop:87995 length:459 start_codon:yes stop_codon:yes gene_type:complete